MHHALGIDSHIRQDCNCQLVYGRRGACRDDCNAPSCVRLCSLLQYATVLTSWSDSRIMYTEICKPNGPRLQLAYRFALGGTICLQIRLQRVWPHGRLRCVLLARVHPLHDTAQAQRLERGCAGERRQTQLRIREAQSTDKANIRRLSREHRQLRAPRQLTYFD